MALPINIFTCDGTASAGADLPNEDPRQVGGGFPASLAIRLLQAQPGKWNWFPIEYLPGFSARSLPVKKSVERGIRMTLDQIASTPGPIVLSGLSQGTWVLGQVYDEIRYGKLSYRASDLLAVVQFGDGLRPAGWTIPLPGAFDPGGGGAVTYDRNMSFGTVVGGRIQNPDPFYWSFANIGDAASTSPSNSNVENIIGQLAELVYEGDIESVLDLTVAVVQGVLTGFSIQDIQDAIDTIQSWLGLVTNPGNPHARYNDPYPYTSMTGNTKSAVTLAFEYLSGLADGMTITPRQSAAPADRWVTSVLDLIPV